MINNSSYLSPWIYELKRDRNAQLLQGHATTDCVIIGGGISGVLTAEALLSSTKHNVILVDAGKIAHGATGHNAGQLTTYIERSLKSILNEYSKEAVYNTLHAIEHANEKLIAIKELYNMSVPIYFFEGYTGIRSTEQLYYFIEQQLARIEIGLTPWSIYITQEFLNNCGILSGQYSFFSMTDTMTIQKLLVTDSSDYHAAIAEQKGCTNSAQFTEELATTLLERFPERLTIYENSPVTSINLNESITTTINKSLTITSRFCVLCTNGFENFTISSLVSDIDSFFHTSIEGLVGYMGAYTDTPVDAPTAISYLTNKTDFEDYYYLTRRPFTLHDNTTHNLISVGGPDDTLDEIIKYNAFTQVDESTRNTIEQMLKKNYKPAKDSDFKFSFLWHGLMGYTKTRLRMVGPDPRDSRLLYNLGCNGVGILTAVISAPRIADIISGKPVLPSLFDVTNK